MNIRPVSLKDISSIAMIQSAVWQTTYQKNFPAEIITQLTPEFFYENCATGIKNYTDGTLPQIIWLVAEIDDTVVGHIVAGPARRTHEFTNYGEIRVLNIHPHYHRQKIGHKLITQALTELEKQYKVVYLKVVEDNTKAQQFYQQHGFHDSGIRHHDTFMEQPLINAVYIKGETHGKTMD